MNRKQQKAMFARMNEYKNWQKQHPNFMTPNVIKSKISKDGKIVELSQGKGFEGENIYGLSYIGYKNGKFITGEDNRSKMYFSKRKAMRKYTLEE